MKIDKDVSSYYSIEIDSSGATPLRCRWMSHVLKSITSWQRR